MKQNFTLKKTLAQGISINAGLTLLMLLITLGLNAQAVKEYTSAEADVLKTDLAAGTYDIYELITDGGNYVLTCTATSNIILNKNVTIRAKTGLVSKPIISYNGTATTSTAAVFVPNIPSMIMKLEGIEFDGINKGSGAVHYLVRSATGSSPFDPITATQDFQLIVKNCYFYGFGETTAGKGVIRMEGKGSSVDIQNSVFNNCLGRLICMQSVAVDPYVLYGDIILKNNTFSNILNDPSSGNGIVTFRSSGGGTQLAKGNNFTLDHCTFYNCKSFAGSDIFLFRTMKGLISITNCIFDQVSNGITFTNPDLTAPPMVINFNYLAGFGNPPTGTNTISTVPAYTNTATLNFGLTDRAPFAGSDSYTIGNTMYYSIPTSVSNLVKGKGNGNSSLRLYPNPASEKVTFDYTLEKSANVKISVYNLSNQLVKSYMNNEPHGAGSYSRSFDVSDLSTGVYFVRMTTGTTSKTVKVVVKR
jgi:hypothetical protein